MNLLKQIKYIVVAGSFMAFALTGCKKANSGTALVGIHLHTYIDSSVLSPGFLLQNSYPDSLGRWEYLQYAQFYITNVSFHSATTKQWVTVTNSILLKREENEPYLLGNITADTYDDVRFTYGLSNSLDNSTPSSFSTTTGADTVLSTSENFMYVGSGQGYAFMKVAGWVDTTVAHNGQIPNLPYFNYTIGGIGDTLQITLPQQLFTLTPLPGEQLVHIICDYGKLLQNIQVTDPAYSVGNSFGTTTQQNAAQKVFNAIKNMFRYECYSPTVDC